MDASTTPSKSGAAGSATFPGSESRKFNYFEPKGRKATHYEDMTLDVQPDPERYLLQDWIINFPDGTPTYSKDWTRAKSADWHKYRSIDQEWERTHYQRQSTICGTIQSVIENGRRSGAAARFDKSWVKVLQDHVGAYKHAEFGLGVALMQAQRYGYTQMINNAILTNSSYKLRFAQDLTLYLGEVGLDIDGGIDKDAGKRHWLEDPIWQGTRRIIEEIMGSQDYLEQYVATNFVFEPLIGELFRSGFVLQMAAAHNDFITPSVVSAAESDYERNLANSVELVHTLLTDRDYSLHNKVIIGEWVEKYSKLAHTAAAQLQPIWSLPRVKIASFTDSFELARNRFNNVLTQCGLPVPAVTA
jgi:propane monooxygenase small subunit